MRELYAQLQALAVGLHGVEGARAGVKWDAVQKWLRSGASETMRRFGALDGAALAALQPRFFERSAAAVSVGREAFMARLATVLVVAPAVMLELCAQIESETRRLHGARSSGIWWDAVLAFVRRSVDPDPSHKGPTDDYRTAIKKYEVDASAVELAVPSARHHATNRNHFIQVRAPRAAARLLDRPAEPGRACEHSLAAACDHFLTPAAACRLCARTGCRSRTSRRTSPTPTARSSGTASRCSRQR
jgi:hypothetical protein